MQDAYKRILVRRRSQLVEQVPWTRELAAGLERCGLMSREELRAIELEMSHKNRIFTAVNKVISRDQPGTFEQFRRLLVEAGADNMAESLEFDRQRIQWEFEKPTKAATVGQYIDLINADLLQASLTEPEENIRQRMILEAKRRLDQLRTSRRQQELDRQRIRSSLLQAAGSSLEKLHCNELFGADRLTLNAGGLTLAELEDVETRKDELVADEIRSVFDQLRHTVLGLQNDNKRLRDIINSHQLPLPLDCLSFDYSDEDSRDLQCTTINEDSLDTTETDENEFIRIPKTEFEFIMQTLKPLAGGNIPPHNYSRQNSTRKSGSSSPTSLDADTAASPPPEVCLSQLVQCAFKELERSRKRSYQLNCEVRRLELELEANGSWHINSFHNVLQPLQVESFAGDEARSTSLMETGEPVLQKARSLDSQKLPAQDSGSLEGSSTIRRAVSSVPQLTTTASVGNFQYLADTSHTNQNTEGVGRSEQHRRAHSGSLIQGSGVRSLERPGTAVLGKRRTTPFGQSSKSNYGQINSRNPEDRIRKLSLAY